MAGYIATAPVHFDLEDSFGVPPEEAMTIAGAAPRTAYEKGNPVSMSCIGRAWWDRYAIMRGVRGEEEFDSFPYDGYGETGWEVTG